MEMPTPHGATSAHGHPTQEADEEGWWHHTMQNAMPSTVPLQPQHFDMAARDEEQWPLPSAPPASLFTQQAGMAASSQLPPGVPPLPVRQSEGRMTLPAAGRAQTLHGPGNEVHPLHLWLQNAPAEPPAAVAADAPHFVPFGTPPTRTQRRLLREGGPHRDPPGEPPQEPPGNDQGDRPPGLEDFLSVDGSVQLTNL